MKTLEITQLEEPEGYEISGDNLLINFQLEQVAPDRVQYKPYGLSWSGYHVYVQVSVPKEEVVQLTEGSDKPNSVTSACVVLTPKGAAMVADQLATAIDDIHNTARGRNKTF